MSGEGDIDDKGDESGHGRSEGQPAGAGEARERKALVDMHPSPTPDAQGAADGREAPRAKAETAPDLLRMLFNLSRRERLHDGAPVPTQRSSCRFKPPCPAPRAPAARQRRA